MSEATLEAPAPVETEGDPMEVKLRAVDRCDQRSCGAQAFVRVVMPGGGDLLFCGHHGRKHEVALREKALKIYDYTNTINEKPSCSANAE